MKATKDHISLETAKLLKDCGVESKYVWGKEYPYSLILPGPSWQVFPARMLNIEDADYIFDVRAYSWQEILWEHAEKFFGDRLVRFGRSILDKASVVEPCNILQYLQQGECDKADEYFRKHCILIPQPTNE